MLKQQHTFSGTVPLVMVYFNFPADISADETRGRAITRKALDSRVKLASQEEKGKYCCYPSAAELARRS